MNPELNRRALVVALKTIKDPEVGLDIVAMGLLYGARLENGTLTVEMTMTTPYCPLAPFFTQEVSRVAKEATGHEHVEVQFVFVPLWHPTMIDQSEQS